MLGRMAIGDYLSSIWLRILGTRADIPELAAINTTILKNGALVFVTSPGSIYALLRDSTAVADGFQIVAPLEGPGRWVRQSAASGSGLLIQDPDWYVDPVNGDDANDGLTPATALKTYEYGLSPRFNGGRFAQDTTVHQLGSVPLEDVYWANTSQAGVAAGRLNFVGEGATVLATGVITAATAAAAGTRAQFTVAGADFTGMENKRVRITAGGDVDAVGWIQQVSAVDTVFVNQPFNLTSLLGTGQFQVGDTIVVEELDLAPGLTGINSQRWDTPDPSALTFESLQIGVSTPFDAGPFLDLGPCTLLGCALNVTVGWLQGQVINKFLGCSVRTQILSVTLSGEQEFTNCALTIPEIICQQVTMDRCSQMGAMTLVTGTLLTSNYLQIWNWTTASLAAITLQPGAYVNASGEVGGSSANANTYGIRARSGSRFVYDPAAKPTVAGAAAFDVDCGGTQVVYAAVPVVSATNLAAVVERAP